MKKLLYFTLIIVLGASIYYDLSEGTLLPPSDESNISSEEISASPSNVSPSTALDGQKTAEVTVERGQTVLTIVEKLHDGPVPASIEDISNDFKKLNDGLSPEDIQADTSYVFPLYNTST